MTILARALLVPITMRSGCLKSWIAAPSRRNSGFETTAKSASGRISQMMRSTSSLVPTGTVDFVTTTVKPASAIAISRRRRINIGQVGVAVAAARGRTDRDKDDVGVGHGLLKVRGKIKT